MITVTITVIITNANIKNERYDDRASDYQDVEQPRYNKQSIIPDHDKVRGNAAVSVKAGKPKG